MLEDHIAVEVRLKECARLEPRILRRHCIRLVDFPECEMESLLIAVYVAVIEVRVVVVVFRQAERPPTALLVDQDLPGLNFRLIAVADAKDAPAGMS